MASGMNVMRRAQNSKRKELTREERRERRLLRREKQQKDNIGRAAKMHAPAANSSVVAGLLAGRVFRPAELASCFERSHQGGPADSNCGTRHLPRSLRLDELSTETGGKESLPLRQRHLVP